MAYLILLVDLIFINFHQMGCYQTRHFDNEVNYRVLDGCVLHSGGVFQCLQHYTEPFLITHQNINGLNQYCVLFGNISVLFGNIPHYSKKLKEFGHKSRSHTFFTCYLLNYSWENVQEVIISWIIHVFI